MKHFSFVGIAVSVFLVVGCTSGPGFFASKKPSENYIDCSTVMQNGVYKGTCDVTCSVNALAINFDGIQQNRACSARPRKVTAELAPTAVSGRWLGKIEGVQPEDPTRFEVVPNGKGGGSVARTPFGSFAVDEIKISGGIHYRQQALQSVREELNTVDARRIRTHRIMDYNNHPDTTLQEIHSLLRQAQAKVEKDF